MTVRQEAYKRENLRAPFGISASQKQRRLKQRGHRVKKPTEGPLVRQGKPKYLCCCPPKKGRRQKRQGREMKTQALKGNG